MGATRRCVCSVLAWGTCSRAHTIAPIAVGIVRRARASTLNQHTTHDDEKPGKGARDLSAVVSHLTSETTRRFIV